MSADFNENVIEFLEDDEWAWFTFSKRKYITQMKKLAKKYPDKCRIEEETTDHVYGKIPVTWVRIQVKPEMSAQQKEMAKQSGRNLYSILKGNQSKN